MPIYKRGDIVVIAYPNSDMQTVKIRPALVVQADGLDTGLRQTLVALITSRTWRTGLSRVSIKADGPDGAATGLLSDSVVVADNLATVEHEKIYKRIGEYRFMHKVDVALKIALGLSSGNSD